MSNKRNTKETVATRVCTVSGLTRPETEFYKGQNHLKAIDNLLSIKANGETIENN